MNKISFVKSSKMTSNGFSTGTHLSSTAAAAAVPVPRWWLRWTAPANRPAICKTFCNRPITRAPWTVCTDTRGPRSRRWTISAVSRRRWSTRCPTTTTTNRKTNKWVHSVKTYWLRYEFCTWRLTLRRTCPNAKTFSYIIRILTCSFKSTRYNILF